MVEGMTFPKNRSGEALVQQAQKRHDIGSQGDKQIHDAEGLATENLKCLTWLEGETEDAALGKQNEATDATTLKIGEGIADSWSNRTDTSVKPIQQDDPQEEEKKESVMEIDVGGPNSMEERVVLAEVTQNVLQGVAAKGTNLQKRKTGSWKRRAREGQPIEHQGVASNKENCEHNGMKRSRGQCETTEVQLQEELSALHPKHPKIESNLISPRVEVASQK